MQDNFCMKSHENMYLNVTVEIDLFNIKDKPCKVQPK